MFGLDERIAAFSDGASIWIVLVVAVLLGLRHATDPDHLAAVTTLVADGRERAASRAAGRGLPARCSAHAPVAPRSARWRRLWARQASLSESGTRRQP